MKYFTECKTAEDVKKAYKNWAKKLHPDCGGDAEQFKQMMAEYETVFERLKTVHVNTKGEEYRKATTETPQAFADIINKVIHLKGVTIEIIGSWVWLTGNTLLYKETIKAAGFFWSRNKQAWYYNGEEKKSPRRGRYNMGQLRTMWGTTEIRTEEQMALT